jgi:hypothetical protein
MRGCEGSSATGVSIGFQSGKERAYLAYEDILKMAKFYSVETKDFNVECPRSLVRETQLLLYLLHL